MTLRCVKLGALGIAAILATISVAFAQDDDDRQTVAVAAGSHVAIGEHAIWSRDCQGGELPNVFLDKPLTHGVICTRKDTIQPTLSRSGTNLGCLGKPLAGLRVIYLPHIHFVGNETVNYAVQFPRGRVAREIGVRVETHVSGGAAGLPPASRGSSQSAGAVPECTEPTS